MPFAKHKQELNAQEQKLQSSLSKIYDNIKRDMNLGISPRVTWNEIKRVYQTRAEDAIRSAVTETYRISAQKTVEQDVKLPFFLTQTDMNKIKELYSKYRDWFWIGMEREIVKTTVMAYDPITLMHLTADKLTLKDTFIGRMTESMHGEVAAQAVISKTRQVVNIKSDSLSRLGQLRLGSRFHSPSHSLVEYRGGAVGTGQELVPHLTWKTAEDERVCDICSDLDGSTYAIDDPATPVPSDDTHPRCRCELVLEDAEIEDEEGEIADLNATDIF